MAHPYHHSLSSVHQWGGTVEDYLALHSWFDESKQIVADFRHRALRHHAEGIFMAERFFGATLTLSTGRIVPVRWVGEQHVREDLGRIPSFGDWVRAIRPEPWMGRMSALGIQDALPGAFATAAPVSRTPPLSCELIAALKDLLGDRPDIQDGVCVRCGRDYRDAPEREGGNCPSDDCPAFVARAALANARGGAS